MQLPVIADEATAVKGALKAVAEAGHHLASLRVRMAVRNEVPRPRTQWGSRNICFPAMHVLSYYRTMVTSHHNPGGFLGEALDAADREEAEQRMRLRRR